MLYTQNQKAESKSLANHQASCIGRKRKTNYGTSGQLIVGWLMIVKTFSRFLVEKKKERNKVQSAPFYHLDVCLISDRMLAKCVDDYWRNDGQVWVQQFCVAT